MKNRDHSLIRIALCLATLLGGGGMASGRIGPNATQVDRPTVRQMIGATETMNSFNGLGSAKDVNCAIKPSKKLASVGELGRHQVGLSRDFYQNGANCEGFVQRDGTYGEWGRMIEQGFENNPRFEETLLSEQAANNKSMQKVCPNFASLDKSDRVRFWVWAMASIAWKESTCRNVGTVRCTKSNCVGLMQLNEPRHMRYWRGPACGVASVADPRRNLMCAMEIMRGQFAGQYGKPGGLSPNSYWQELRTNGKSPIKSRMAKFPGCHPTSLKALRGGGSNERRKISKN